MNCRSMQMRVIHHVIKTSSKRADFLRYEVEVSFINFTVSGVAREEYNARTRTQLGRKETIPSERGIALHPA